MEKEVMLKKDKNLRSYGSFFSRQKVCAVVMIWEGVFLNLQSNSASTVLKVKDSFAAVEGSGPRHLTFSKRRYVYVLQELLEV
jgi:6-phosphogluconolactonase (cycloisomerase 2 family)